MRKRIKVLLVLLFISSLARSTEAERTQYTHITTIKSPTPFQEGGFGGDFALSGDFLIVGETGAQVDDKNGAGKAYLFDSNWELITNLTSPSPQEGGVFSRSLDIQGDIIAVSSHKAKIEGIGQAGEVHVFDSTGSHLYSLHSSQPTINCKFSRRVAIGNGILLIGQCPDNSCKGTIPVYDLEEIYLTTLATSEMIDSSAGEAIVADEDLIFIGGIKGYGSVFVFDYEWNLVKTLQSPEPQLYTYYGNSVAVSGDHFVVGEMWATVDGHRRAGRAYIYDTDWNLVAALQSPTPEEDAEFGVDVSIGVDFVVVGEGKGDVTNGDEGKVYVFDHEGNLLFSIASPEPKIGAHFGSKVLTDGEILVVGEVDATVDEVSGAGKVHVFKLGASVEAGEPVEETTTETETESGSESSRGIPGYPLWSIGVALLLISIIIANSQKQ